MTIDEVAEMYDGEEMLKIDGFDDCFVGVVTRFGLTPLLCYDRDKILAKLIVDSGGEMSPSDAEEFFEFNIIGAWLGDGTPCFISLLGE